MDPAVEAQAVSRVHRIGQQKKTYVHHFVVNNSVEQNVYKLNRERAASSDVSAVAANRDKNPDQRFTVRSACRSLPQFILHLALRPMASLALCLIMHTHCCRDVALLLEKPWIEKDAATAAATGQVAATATGAL